MSSLDDTKNFIEKNGNFDSKIGLSVLVEKDSDNIIGLAGLLECDYLGEKDFEFGFILAQEFWGKGYATEIGQAQIDFVKNELKRDRVLAIAAPENSSSIKTIKKLGLKLEKSITLNERGNREVYLKQL